MKINIKQAGQRALGKTRAVSRKHGPDILTAAGVVGFGVTTVLVGKAVVRSHDKRKALKFKTNEISERPLDEQYTRSQQTREMGQLWIHEGRFVLKDFAPALVVGSASVICVITAHGMLKRQRTALIAAYAALDTGFRAYRKRVQAEVGEEREQAIFRGPEIWKVTEGDDEVPQAEFLDPDMLQHHGSQYARFFDETSKNWTKTPEWNRAFLLQMQSAANDRLRAYGYLFLNEVYQDLGFERTQAGQAVGWKLNGDGDGFVSFGLDVIYDDSSRAFTNGLEHTTLLDFNVDGVITID